MVGVSPGGSGRDSMLTNSNLSAAGDVDGDSDKADRDGGEAVGHLVGFSTRPHLVGDVRVEHFGEMSDPRRGVRERPTVLEKAVILCTKTHQK
jgi:hypothetical protein